MKITINYDEIFFGKFDMTEEEKRSAAIYIAEKVFSEAMAENGGSVLNFGDNIVIEAKGYMAEIEEELAFKKLKFLLAKEFFIFIEKEEAVQEEPPEEPSSDAAERYIKQNYMYATLSAEEVAKKIGMRRAAIDKMFKEKHGVSVTEFIKMVRVEKAKVMIDGGIPLRECAEECGFGSEKTMKRAFVAIEGMSPHEYAMLDSKGAR